MDSARRIKPKGTPVFRTDVTTKGFIMKETKHHVMDFSASSPITIEDVYPEIDSGRFAVKREVGDTMDVYATIFKDGHDLLSAVVMCRRADSQEWWEVPMVQVNEGEQRWGGTLYFWENTRYVYTIEAWVDEYGTWVDGLIKKLDAGQQVGVELEEGARMIRKTLQRVENDNDVRDPEAQRLDIDLFREVLDVYGKLEDQYEVAQLLLDDGLISAMARWPDKEKAYRYDRELEVWVDRERARFGAWYEMFPRNQSEEWGKHGTFKDCERRLPDIQAMGFDVLYLLPIHPIGRIHRKGKNNTLVAYDDDVGSPYAVGSYEGGHTAIHPELGTLDDFRSLVHKAQELGMEVALDFAIQCAPDHPWIKEHPEWFSFRPDGTIKYAENRRKNIRTS